MSTKTEALLAGHPPGEWRVLVVEDTLTIQVVLRALLTSRGIQVRAVGDGRAGIDQVVSWRPDLILLDLGLPDIDGLVACEQIREVSDAFVIMLTGRGDDASRKGGLRIGADAYITKPFDSEDLMLNIEVLLRRAAPTGGLAERIDHGQLTIERLLQKVTLGGKPVHLTKIEFTLLELLLVAAGDTVSRENLVAALWGPHWVGDDHVISVHMANLRKKVDPTSTGLIETIRGVGYRLAS